jgi:hypothetical protein
MSICSFCAKLAVSGVTYQLEDVPSNRCSTGTAEYHSSVSSLLSAESCPPCKLFVSRLDKTRVKKVQADEQKGLWTRSVIHCPESNHHPQHVADKQFGAKFFLCSAVTEVASSNVFVLACSTGQYNPKAHQTILSSLKELLNLMSMP